MRNPKFSGFDKCKMLTAVLLEILIFKLLGSDLMIIQNKTAQSIKELTQECRFKSSLQYDVQLVGQMMIRNIWLPSVPHQSSLAGAHIVFWRRERRTCLAWHKYTKTNTRVHKYKSSPAGVHIIFGRGEWGSCLAWSGFRPLLLVLSPKI